MAPQKIAKSQETQLLDFAKLLQIQNAQAAVKIQNLPRNPILNPSSMVTGQVSRPAAKPPIPSNSSGIASRKSKLSLQLSTDSNESGLELSDAVKLAYKLKNGCLGLSEEDDNSSEIDVVNSDDGPRQNSESFRSNNRDQACHNSSNCQQANCHSLLQHNPGNSSSSDSSCEIEVNVEVENIDIDGQSGSNTSGNFDSPPDFSGNFRRHSETNNREVLDDAGDEVDLNVEESDEECGCQQFNFSHNLSHHAMINNLLQQNEMKNKQHLMNYKDQINLQISRQMINQQVNQRHSLMLQQQQQQQQRQQHILQQQQFLQKQRAQQSQRSQKPLGLKASQNSNPTKNLQRGNLASNLQNISQTSQATPGDLLSANRPAPSK